MYVRFLLLSEDSRESFRGMVNSAIHWIARTAWPILNFNFSSLTRNFNLSLAISVFLVSFFMLFYGRKTLWALENSRNFMLSPYERKLLELVRHLAYLEA